MSKTTKKWMSQLEGDFAKVASSMPKPSDSVISLGSPSFNFMVGNGGITEGKAVCLYGGESSGKSLIAQLILVEIQKKYPESIQIVIDSEFSFNPVWFKKLGGDLDRLLVKQTNNPVEIFDWLCSDVHEMLKEGAPINGLMIDSVKAIQYPGDVKKVSTDLSMGGAGAKYLGPALKALLPIVRTYNITTLLIQQVYEEMDQYKKMNNPYIVPDGRALKHWSDYMLQVDRVDTKAGRIEEGETMVGGSNQVGHKVRVKGKKNRVGAPYRVAEFSLRYTTGIVDTENEIYELAKSMDIITHPVNKETGKINTQMWSFRDYTPIKGESNIKAFITSNPKILKEAYDDCLSASESAIEIRNKNVKSVEIDIED